MSVVDLTSKLAALPAPTIEELGGVETLERLGAGFALDLHADRMVGAIARAPMPNSALTGIVVAVIENNAYPLVVGAALVHARAMKWPDNERRWLQRALLGRIQQRSTPLEADMASECLAGAFLLAADGHVSRLAFLSQLEDVHAGEQPMYLRRAARIAGLAWVWDRTPELRAVLERLKNDGEVGDQALYELGLIQLDDALEAEDREAVLNGLSGAAETFEAAVQHEPDLIQAEAIGASVRAVTLFCRQAPSVEVERQLGIAKRSFDERALHLDRSALRSWLRPRIDVETTWHQLAVALGGLSDALAERSWLRAVAVLERIAAVRRALISVASREGDGLRRVATDRFASSFLAQEGLRTHVEAWSQDPEISEPDRIEARGLLDAIERARDPASGKVYRLAGTPTTAGRDESTVGSESRPRLRGIMRHLLEARSWITTEKFEQVFLELEQGLNNHPDFSGSVRNDLQVILLFLIHFLGHSLDVGSRMAEGTFGFLFDRGSPKPLEIELQRALFTTLRLQLLGIPQHSIVSELPDVAAGRADVAVLFPSWRLVIEVKRESEDGSREGIRRYLGQAASYELTGPRIGVLVVLDLCSQKHWTLTLEDNCWFERVVGEGDSISRTILVFRIPGMRALPSATRTPIS